MHKISAIFQNLLTTRPDIGYIANTVAYSCLHASSEDIKFVGRIIGHIRKLADWELVLPCTDKHNKLQFELNSDASHRTDFSIGWLILINGNLIDSGSKIIKDTYTNCTMCELVALEHGVQKLGYIMNILRSVDLSPHARCTSQYFRE